MFGFLKKKDSAAKDVAADAPGPESGSWFTRLKAGLSKTRERLASQVTGLFGAGRRLDEAFYEELENALMSADVGVPETQHLIETPPP